LNSHRLEVTYSNGMCGKGAERICILRWKGKQDGGEYYTMKIFVIYSLSKLH